LPFYNRLLARSGFEVPAAQIMDAAKRRDPDAMSAAVNEEMVDALALVGPEARCHARLEQYRRAGAEVPILVPNAVEEDYSAGVRRVLKAFAS
jgi:alkanesulfonate monooxygenase SsuD/methylene tetrahydromethanopterin reductase-like flavin-dependent oxidoreductase (luciferase family)